MWNSLRHKLHLARGLSFSDWLSLLEGWWALAFFYLALRWVSLERLLEEPSLRAVFPGAARQGRCAKQSPRARRLPPFDFAQDKPREDRPPRNDDDLNETREHLSVARRLHRLIGWAAGLHLLPMTCLAQSLALRWMLGRRGIASQMQIGAAKDPRGFRAHAWLEVDGEKVGESQDADGIFRVLKKRNL